MPLIAEAESTNAIVEPAQTHTPNGDLDVLSKLTEGQRQTVEALRNIPRLSTCGAGPARGGAGIVQDLKMPSMAGPTDALRKEFYDTVVAPWQKRNGADPQLQSKIEWEAIQKAIAQVAPTKEDGMRHTVEKLQSLHLKRHGGGEAVNSLHSRARSGRR